MNDQKNILKQKDVEIERLQEELKNAKKTSKELNTKDREIEKLQNLVKNMQISRDSLSTSSSRFSLEQLSDSFNELKFQQAIEEKKKSQLKIDEVLSKLGEVANAATRIHVNNLNEQMKIVVEKQELTDDALERCTNLCAHTLGHLNYLARFLSSLLQQKEIRESLDVFSLTNIQSAVDKTIEFSENPGRFSTGDGRLSSLPDISCFDLLMTSVRHSIGNVCESHSGNKSVQAEDRLEMEALQSEVETAKTELDKVKNEAEELNRVNQLLEDEICRLKEAMEDYKLKLFEGDTLVIDLKAEKCLLNSMFQESQNKIQILTSALCELENKLQEETVKKFECETRLDTSESLAMKLQEKLETLRQDLETNWISKSDHDIVKKKLEDDIINGDAQVAAIRMEMDTLVSTYNELKAKKEAMSEDKENLNSLPQLKTLEISEDRLQMLSLESDEALPDADVVAPTSSCLMCPKYLAKIHELKSYLFRAIEKIKRQQNLEKLQTQKIRNQLTSTESVLQSARSNMDKILKDTKQLK